MSKKQREKETIKIEQELIEKKAIELRRQERVAPMYKTAKLATIVVVTTFFILYFGVMVNNRLPDILIKLAENG